jgi:hypothetical protein
MIRLDGVPARVMRAFRRQRSPVVHVPERRENVARPREHRARRVRSKTSARGDPDPEPEPPLEVLPLSRFRRDLDAWLGAAS